MVFFFGSIDGSSGRDIALEKSRVVGSICWIED